MRTASVVGGFVAVTITVGACNAVGKGPGAKEAGSIRVDPGGVQDRAKAPPPPSTTIQTSLGKGTASVKTANATGDIDRYWVQELDIDGDGTVEQTELIWDDEDKVLFAYAETDVPCTIEGTAVVAVLVAVNGEGNRRERPAGSGFYAVYLDLGECGAGVAGLFGCNFNARGKSTECGAAVIDQGWDILRVGGAAEQPMTPPTTTKKKSK